MSEELSDEIVFNLRLTEADWSPSIRAWNCPAFDIPGAFVREVFDPEGKRLAPSMFKVEKAPARLSWLGEGAPSKVTVIVGLKEKLSTKPITDFWKGFAIIVPIITALIAAGATYLSRPNATPPRTLSLTADLGTGGGPSPRLTLNNKDYAFPVEYRVDSDVKGVIDLSRNYSYSKAMADIVDASISNLNTAARQINDFTLRVTGNVCPGGSNGRPPQDSARIGEEGSAIQNAIRSIAGSLNAAKQAPR